VIGLLVSGTMLLLLDQWSKKAVQLLASNRCVSWTPFLRIRYVINLNGTFHPNTRILLVLAWFASLISAVLLRRSGFWFQGEASVIGLGMAFGGAAGNLLDMLRYRFVVDFIDLRGWPVFNLADVGIVGGLALAFWR